jgi:hypothetical protein
MNTHTLHLVCTINGKSHRLNSHRKAYSLHLMRAEAQGFKALTLTQFIRIMPR